MSGVSKNTWPLKRNDVVDLTLTIEHQSTSEASTKHFGAADGVS